jgi:hypothetical protein
MEKEREDREGMYWNVERDPVPPGHFEKAEMTGESLGPTLVPLALRFAQG